MRALKACCAALLLGLSAQAGFEGITCLDWSPAGDKLLLASQGALYLGEAPTARGAYRLPPDKAWVTWGRFGPEGDWYLYATPVEDGYALWKGFFDDRDPEELFHSPSPIHQPTVSADGRWVAFVGEEDGQTDLFLLDLESGELTRLTRTPFEEACPDFSPDGGTLAFVGLWAPEGGSWDLFLIDLETGAIQQLTEDQFFDWYPRFSPDGEWIAFESNRSGLSDIYVIRRDGSDLTPFTYDGWRDAFPAWSPDGEEIAYAQRKPSGWVILAEGAY
jgi:Tol biopolymer transport system component